MPDVSCVYFPFTPLYLSMDVRCAVIIVSIYGESIMYCCNMLQKYYALCICSLHHYAVPFSGTIYLFWYFWVCLFVRACVCEGWVGRGLAGRDWG